MRITNGMLQAQALSGLRTNMAGLSQLQEQISTGKRINRASDDPIGLSSVLQTNSSLGAIAQYKRNLAAVEARQTVEEQALTELTNVLERARELGVSQATDTATQQTRSVTQAEVDQLLDFAIGLGNTDFQGRFIFGGFYSDRAPFTSTTPDPNAPPDGELQVEVGPNQLVSANHSGQQIFVDTGAFAALEELSTALANDDTAAIQNALFSIDSAHDGVQQLVGEVGGRMNSLQVMAQNLDALEVNLDTLRSSIEDTDFEGAVTELVNRQTTFQAALAANAQILGQSLVDYL